MVERITIGSREYSRFIPHPRRVRDGTVRCISCGQIDEPKWHDFGLCDAARLTGRTLSRPQRTLLLASDPDDRTGDEGVGVELRTGGDYAAAKALERFGLGTVEGPGGPLPGMYWSNADGLRVRSALRGDP